MSGLSRRAFVSLAAGGVGLGASAGGLALWSSGVPLPGRAQAEPPLVAYLAPVAEGPVSNIPTFREGLLEQGLVEGRDLRLEVRYGEGRPERLPGLAAELLALDPRIIVTGGGTTALAVRAATDRVPHVAIEGGDLVALGWAASYGRPGGNVTGIRGYIEGVYPKGVELLKAVVPASRRLAFLTNTATPAGGRVQDVSVAAAAVGLELLVEDTRAPEDVEPAFERALTWGADILYTHFVIPLNVPLEWLPELAWRGRIPAASASMRWTRAGFLLAYGYDGPAVYRRGAWYVARILAGTQPGDLPIEVSSVYGLQVNRATLAYLGLTVPEHVALQVTEWVG